MSAEVARDRVLLCALTLASLAVQIPFLGRGLSRLDEGSILAIADALNRGEVLYRDRATFIAPVIYEGMALLAAWFGSSLWVGRIVQALVFSACTLLVYRVLREFADWKWAMGSALAFLAVKPLAFPLWTIPNYSQWATLVTLTALLCGLCFLRTRDLRWLAASGFAVGIAGVTKQTGAGIIGIALASTVALDALLARPQTAVQRTRALLARGALLFASALPPIACFAIYYAVNGALPDAVDRAVLGLLDYSGALGVPLPDLSIWSTDPAVLGPKSFIYFPTAVLALAWQGGLNLYSTGTALAVECAVKLAYYGPVLAGLAALVPLRGLAGADRQPALRIGFVALLAMLAYWSASFRADWTHLMSVAPELILLCAVVLHDLAQRARPFAWLAVLVCGAWLIGGALVGVAALSAYATPVRTARGELRVTPAEASSTRAVLDWAEAQPQESRVAFLPTQPLFYSLAERPIPSPFDLLIPAYFRDGDDETLAADLEDVDQIVYDPNAMPTIDASLSEFAPRSAAVLAERFGFVRALSPTAYLLETLPRSARQVAGGTLVVDLFDRVASGAGIAKPDRSENAHWVMYRVLAATLRKQDARSCFSIAHRVGPDEWLSFVPLLPPQAWGGANSPDALQRGRFSVALQEKRVDAQSLYAESRAAGDPIVPAAVSLHDFAGRDVTLQLCVSRLVGDPARAAVLGFGEARILRGDYAVGS